MENLKSTTQKTKEQAEAISECLHGYVNKITVYWISQGEDACKRYIKSLEKKYNIIVT